MGPIPSALGPIMIIAHGSQGPIRKSIILNLWVQIFKKKSQTHLSYTYFFCISGSLGQLGTGLARVMRKMYGQQNVIMSDILKAPRGILHAGESSLTVYPKKYAHGSCFFGFVVISYRAISSISFRVASLALGQSNDCPSASKVTLKNMGKWIMWMEEELMI